MLQQVEGENDFQHQSCYEPSWALGTTVISQSTTTEIMLLHVVAGYFMATYSGLFNWKMYKEKEEVPDSGVEGRRALRLRGTDAIIAFKTVIAEIIFNYFY